MSSLQYLKTAAKAIKALGTCERQDKSGPYFCCQEAAQRAIQRVLNQFAVADNRERGAAKSLHKFRAFGPSRCTRQGHPKWLLMKPKDNCPNSSTFQPSLRRAGRSDRARRACRHLQDAAVRGKCRRLNGQPKARNRSQKGGRHLCLCVPLFRSAVSLQPMLVHIRCRHHPFCEPHPSRQPACLPARAYPKSVRSLLASVSTHSRKTLAQFGCGPSSSTGAKGRKSRGRKRNDFFGPAS